MTAVGVDGAAPTFLTDGTHRDAFPQWSPDGQWISFYSNASGTHEVYQIRPDGSGREQVTDFPEHHAFGAAWSREGGG